MADPVVEEYLAGVALGADVTLVTGAGTQAGWVLFAVQGWDYSPGHEMKPPTGTAGDWKRVGYFTLGENGAVSFLAAVGFRYSLWTRTVTSGGAQTVTMRRDNNFQTDNHCRLYVLSGVRAYTPIRFRGSGINSTVDELFSTSHVASQTYAPDDDALLIAIWLSSDNGVGSSDLTLPASLTIQAELDGFFSTSRSGYVALAAAGSTGELTATDSFNNGYCALQIVVSGSQGAVTFPSTAMGFRVELALGADLTDHPDDWTWTDITAYVFWRDGILVTAGRADESSRIEPGSCALTLDNIISSVQGGRFSARNPLSPYFGLLGVNTPIRVWVDPGSGFTERFSGFVPSWPPRWTTGADRYIRINAKGVLYRLGQGTPPEHSSIWHRTMGYRDLGLLGYWPLEDESGAIAALSALPGGQPLDVVGDLVFAHADIDFGGDITVYPADTFGTKPLPSFATGGQLFGRVPRGSSSPIGWTVIVYAVIDPTAAGETVVLMEWETPGGTFAKWRLQETAAPLLELVGTTLSGTATTVFSVARSSLDLYAIVVTAVQDGSNFTITLRLGEDSVLGLDTRAGTLAYVSSFVLNPRANSTSVPWHMGHIEFWDISLNANNYLTSIIPVTYVDDYGEFGISSLLGVKSEAAHLRLVRLCREDGIELTMFPVDEPYIMRMDSQRPGTQLDLYRTSEATDGGVLYEQGFGLGYLTRVGRYNPPVSLAMDYAQGHLWQPPEPVDDDQRLRNRASVVRAFGSTGVFEKRTGPSGVDTVGPYETGGSLTLNISPDENLVDRAALEVAQGTPAEYRYPVISVNLARPDAVELIPDWLNMPTQGGRMTIANPPDDVPPETIDLIREGYTEFLNSKQWEVWANCSPASPWLMWTVEGSVNTGRLDTAGSVVAVDTLSSSTTLPVRRSDRTLKKWSTSVTGYDIEVTPAGYIAGERVTVTAVADVTPSFVAAGAAAHAVNASVTPTLPNHAARDALYVLAAIRNSGAGVPATASAGWERLEVFPTDSNVQLFGKIAESAAETDPTITFSGGVANADTSAQAFRARGTTLDIVAAAAQLNGSAQDIAYPALTLPDDLINWNQVFVLFLGWKQDDWTSVATLASSVEIGEPDTTTGDDQGIVWDRLSVGVAANIASGSFVVTGGTNAISRGAVVAFYVVEQNLTVTRSVNGATLALAPGDDVQLWRPNHLAL